MVQFRASCAVVGFVHDVHRVCAELGEVGEIPARQGVLCDGRQLGLVVQEWVLRRSHGDLFHVFRYSLAAASVNTGDEACEGGYGYNGAGGCYACCLSAREAAR